MVTTPSYAFFKGRIVPYNVLSKLSLIWGFLRVRKKWWLGPIIAMLLLLGLLIVATEGSAVAPFIYTLF